jgi:hypothetical protein
MCPLPTPLSSKIEVNMNLMLPVSVLFYIAARIKVNPNPGGLVANMTSKTQNCCDKFIIHKIKF